MPREARDWKWVAGSVLWPLLRLLFWVALAFGVLDTPPFVALGLLAAVAALFTAQAMMKHYLDPPPMPETPIDDLMAQPYGVVAVPVFVALVIPSGALTFAVLVAMLLIAVTMRLGRDRRTPLSTAAAGSDPVPATLSNHPR